MNLRREGKGRLLQEGDYGVEAVALCADNVKAALGREQGP